MMDQHQLNSRMKNVVRYIEWGDYESALLLANTVNNEARANKKLQAHPYITNVITNLEKMRNAQNEVLHQHGLLLGKVKVIRDQVHDGYGQKSVAVDA